MCSNIRVKTLNILNPANPRNRISLVRKDAIHNKNPWLFKPRRKRDCFQPKREIFSSLILSSYNKIPKKGGNINLTWYFYVGTGTSLGTFEFNPKYSNMHILASWAPFKVVQSM